MSGRSTITERLRRSARVIAWAAFLGAFFACHAGAEPVEPGLRAMLMPGPLSAAHEKDTNNCAVCHESFRKAAQDSLCLKCHEEIGADLDASQGFHGRITGDARVCSRCHGEHLGRDARITRLSRSSIDHARTDFALEGAHLAADCGSCHPAGHKLRDAPHECIGCHRDDDHHRGGMGEKCEDCHGASGWTETRFDHGKTTFALTGKHAEVSCGACHPDNRFRDTPAECVSCHARGDAHKGQRGTDCAACHEPAGWKKITFDHDRDTKFALHGAHRDARCASCHFKADFSGTAGRECANCHAGDDVHAGRNGNQCSDCHGEADWKNSRFDHEKDAHFALRGAHAQARCEACHADGARARKPARSACKDCHLADDVHQGTLGEDCASCHGEQRWPATKGFDHQLVGFPLLGMHATVDCAACHIDRQYSKTGTRCEDCHVQDDTHRGGLGKDCAKCHNPGGWRLAEFDHAAQTRFALDGAHRGLACDACHTEDPGRHKLARECFACHRNDDRHRGDFGRNCERCHATDDWSRVEMGMQRRAGGGPG